MTTTTGADVELSVAADTNATPGQRIQRTAGQAGGSLILLDLVNSFGWFGSDHWTAGQAQAVAAALIFVVAAVHNLINWWRDRRIVVPNTVTVAAEPAPAAKKR